VEAFRAAVAASVEVAQAEVGNMKPKEFIDKLDDTKVMATIAAAEQKSSGEIRVFVSNDKPADALAAAEAEFLKLGMTKTRERNGVLIFFAPKVQQFAVIGDQGIHEKCGADFWKHIATKISAHLKADDFTAAVVEAVTEIGAVLARHFPRSPDDRNELPNQVVRD
jgi:uncharacterized membrane protein